MICIEQIAKNLHFLCNVLMSPLHFTMLRIMVINVS